MTKKDKSAYCPVDYAFQRIGGKYKGRILWYLKDGIMRYGELKRIVEGITPKMLTQTLRELESDELIRRKVYREVPPRVEYRLSETGKELVPFIDQMRIWGEKQMAVD
ncbi:MAG: helix-turn-helix domain-containing protein [Flavobacterium nitrogenifigens]|uniref:winged helix-turn-helix transcriptional regulator n=1 Tax=Flavobacterium nitrogenifigens TaxID=1617283 RepID=UPI002807A579|nr:helix-turn-helix domain-containing protein [Flavobacterium nitrogenifigens]MDQ8014055.1 helix-turn-helix domain-containing protein [Flavobacterium nitrogenifigens]